jgi:peptidoglycan hydrolase-like protein with peptidoglycan-binding domain
LGGFTASVVALAVCAPVAAAAGDPRVAAVQVALHERGLYDGTIDGVDGPTTRRGLVDLQRRAGLIADGIVGPQTIAALGGTPGSRARPLSLGAKGFDVAALQFALAWHGFPCGWFDGRFGSHTDAALRRFQRWAGIAVDGKAGPATLAALAGPLPVAPVPLAYPVDGTVGDGFGPRGTRFHAGVDLIAPFGTPVTAAAAGRVTWAGFLAGGWGKLVIVAHGHGLKTLYAHLTRIDVRAGEPVAVGSRLGLVGATGDATGPHLHFEVRVRGAAVDPLPALR